MQGVSDSLTRRATRFGIVATILNVVGFAFALYLTIEHYQSSPSFACPEGSTLNCLKVTTSSYATFHGVPVALAGLVYFVVSFALHLPAAWRSGSVWLARSRLGWVGIGMLSVFYLIYAELELGAICLYCTGVHIVTFALLVLSAVASFALVDDSDDLDGPGATMEPADPLSAG